MKMNLLPVWAVTLLAASSLALLTGCQGHGEMGMRATDKETPVKNLVVEPEHTGPHQTYQVDVDPDGSVCFDPAGKSTAVVRGNTLIIRIPVKPCDGRK